MWVYCGLLPTLAPGAKEVDHTMTSQIVQGRPTRANHGRGCPMTEARPRSKAEVVASATARGRLPLRANRFRVAAKVRLPAVF